MLGRSTRIENSSEEDRQPLLTESSNSISNDHEIFRIEDDAFEDEENVDTHTYDGQPPVLKSTIASRESGESRVMRLQRRYI